jgi:pSer/pThr/pTyr-binding forkhead associated (FHA) protein
MAKLLLTFDDRVLKECVIGPNPVTIGRHPQSTLPIDNPAVSAQHARVFRDGAEVVIEDVGSANGTFVNEHLVTRHVLRDGDVVLVGKHHLVFSAAGGDVDPAATVLEGIESLESQLAAQGGTMMLDTRKHRELMAKSGMAPQAAAAPAAVKPAAAKPSVGMLRVLAGRVDHTEYLLSGHTSVIGRADTALVRLKGWFKPKAAAAVARRGDVYAITPLSGTTKVNGERIRARQDLRDGDVLEVSGVTLEFHANG